MKQLPLSLKNKKQGFTLLEFMLAAGILGIIAMVMILVMKSGIDFLIKGVATKPQEISQLVLEGEEGRREIEKQGLISTIRGGYSIYRPQFTPPFEFDNAAEPITLETNSIIIGYGIVDRGNGICDSTVGAGATDFTIITQGSYTTTDFKKGTSTITVISPYNINDPKGATSLLLETNPVPDDYGLAIGYQFREIQEGVKRQGRIFKTIYRKCPGGIWTQQGAETLIAQNISQLEFRYFAGGVEIPTGIPTALSIIREIDTVMVSLKVDHDDDGDGWIEEDVLDGKDNDGDKKVDEDYFNGISVTTCVRFRNLRL